MKNKKENRGGARSGSGRKAVEGGTSYKGIRFPNVLIEQIEKRDEDFSGFVIRAIRQKLEDEHISDDITPLPDPAHL